MNKIFDIIRLLRPHQWLKNSFVLVGVIFGHAWLNLNTVYAAIIATIAFSFTSSGVYIINDIIDRHADKLHPTKKKRSIAAGKISVTTAASIAFALLVINLIIGFSLSIQLGTILLTYILLNVLYSLWLKHIVIIDVFVIALGFMLRILAGTIGIGIAPSHWLLLCSLMFTLFLGFTKRYAECNAPMKNRNSTRNVLAYYNPSLLNGLIMITASSAIITYSLYTLSMKTVQIHHTQHLIYTVIFVIFGIFRYLYLLYKDNDITHIDIAYTTMHDKYLVFTLLAWVTSIFYLIL